MSKPVQVFILMGQSNMLGFGKVGQLTNTVKDKRRFTHLMDENGQWTTRKDVRNVRVMNGKTYKNEWLTVNGKNFGPDIAFGHIMGHVIEKPVLVLKSCIGNRALGWDLLPPGSKSYEFNGKTIPGYQGSSDPAKRPTDKGWYAGKQYDDDLDSVKKVLADLGTYYPGAKKHEIAGFVWWQGHKDQKAEWAERYEINLVQLIKALRREFKSPDAPFVCATIAFGGTGMRGHALKVAEAQLSVSNSRKYPQFKGNVKSVDARPFWRGGGAHYGGNPETYMEVGNGLGWAMASLLNQMTMSNVKAHLDRHSRPVYSSILRGRFPAAYSALEAFKAQLDAQPDPAEGVNAERLEVQRTIYGLFKRTLDAAVTASIRDIEDCQSCDDAYGLSLAFTEARKTLTGIPAFDDISKDLEPKLKSREMRAEVANGKKFYKYIEKYIKSEARRRKPRSAKKAASHSKYLAQMARRFGESPYARAALKASQELADPKVPFQEPSYYLR
ncbi:MAG: hypothetical protein CMJ83_17315 [Planctomycetes bacterium]|nr:hypothetical protein [Planctomycetota bacterium]